MSESLRDFGRRSIRAVNQLSDKFEETRLGRSVREIQRQSELRNQLWNEANQLGRQLFDQAALEGIEVTDELIDKTAQEASLGSFRNDVWVGSVRREHKVRDAGKTLLERLGKIPRGYTFVSEEDRQIASTLVLFEGVMEEFINSAGLEGVAERLITEDASLEDVIKQKVNELVLEDRIPIPEDEKNIRLVEIGLANFDEVGEVHLTEEARDMVRCLMFG